MNPAIPEGYTGDVWLRLFDPDNALGLDQNNTSDQIHMPIDNYGNALLYDSSLYQVAVSSNQSTISIPLTILDAHAGDNYVVAAHPNDAAILQYRLNPTNGVTVEHPSGNPDDPDSTYIDTSVPKTPTLTVWRTLWMELDQMAAPTLPTSPGTTSDGFASDEKIQLIQMVTQLVGV